MGAAFRALGPGRLSDLHTAATPAVGPVLALAATAQQVSDAADYSVRAAPAGPQEFDVADRSVQPDADGRIPERSAALTASSAALTCCRRSRAPSGERHDLRASSGGAAHLEETCRSISAACASIGERRGASIDRDSGPRAVASPGARAVEQYQYRSTRMACRAVLQVQLVYEPDTREISFPFPQRFAGRSCSHWWSPH